MSKREGFIQHARSMIGTPFFHQGRSRGGVDCIGLIVLSARSVGVILNDTVNYPRGADGETLLREFRSQTEEVAPDAMLPGDIFAFRMTRKGEPQHVGILTTLYDGAPGLCHTWQSIGKVAEHRMVPQWYNRVVTAFRIPGLD